MKTDEGEAEKKSADFSKLSTDLGQFQADFTKFVNERRATDYPTEIHNKQQCLHDVQDDIDR